MMGRGLFLTLAAALAALVVGTGVGSADPVTIAIQDLDQTVTGLQSTLTTSVDTTLVDAAVTDDQLLSAGVIDTSLMPLLVDPPLLIVDDDLQECPNAQFTTATGIQQAIAAAPIGGKIRVCPGTYDPITVFKPLTLQAPRYQGQATECKAPLPADPTKEAIIEGDNIVAGVQISASNVVFDGFTVENNTKSAGIYTVPTGSGYVIAHNVVQRNVFGLYFNSSGAVQSVARQNCFRDNTNTGAANGNGVYSDQGLRNAVIGDNYFTNHFNAAVVLVGTIATVSGVQITHNESVDDSSIALFDTSNVIVDYNKVIRPDGSAIFVGAGNNAANISFNQLEGGPSSGNGISIRSDAGNTTLPSQNIQIKSNKITTFPSNGIRLGDGAINNTLDTNRALSNGIDGIRATSQASGNVLRQNHMRFNGEHDCHDDSVGAYNAPAFVANQWINDFGFTENKPGLCKHAA
jgi:parallel beta-helix repeat protein